MTCAPVSAARFIISGPAITSDSLFANATRFPESTAAHVAGSPAAPTIAQTTVVISGARIRPSKLSKPRCHAVLLCPLSAADGAGTSAEEQPKTAHAGRNSDTCRHSRSTLRCAAIPTIRRRSECCRTTSRQLVPIDPVEPRTAMVENRDKVKCFRTNETDKLTRFSDEIPIGIMGSVTAQFTILR